GGLLYRTQPVVIAVVVQALWRLGRSCLRAPLPVAAAVAAVVLAGLGVHELIVLFGVGLAVPVLRGMFRRTGGVAPLPMVLFATPTAPAVATSAASFGLWPLFLV